MPSVRIHWMVAHLILSSPLSTTGRCQRMIRNGQTVRNAVRIIMISISEMGCPVMMSWSLRCWDSVAHHVLRPLKKLDRSIKKIWRNYRISPYKYYKNHSSKSVIYTWKITAMKRLFGDDSSPSHHSSEAQKFQKTAGFQGRSSTNELDSVAETNKYMFLVFGEPIRKWWLFGAL